MTTTSTSNHSSCVASGWASETYNDTRLSLRSEEVLYSKTSKFQQIEVVKTNSHGNVLFLDGALMTTEADEYIYHEMLAHVPLCSLPKPPKQVLIIGGGDGGTVREVLRHESIERVVLCEIDGHVIEASRRFLPTIASKLDDTRVDIQVRDGVAYMQEAPDEAFDAILIDSTDPIGPGEGLFNQSFYEEARRVLTPEGVLSAQTESPISEPDNVKTIYAKLKRVFPVVEAYWGVVPTYPGALWSWAFCSKTVRPLEHINDAQLAKLEASNQYLNSGLLKGCFSLPNNLKQVLNFS